MRRREFLVGAAATGGSMLAAASLLAQQAPEGTQKGESNLGPMDQSAAKTVRRPPKAGASPSMSNDERDALERQIRCQCGCTLDVYICRTTDFSCQVSPAMHRDINSLVQGGYSAQEIIDSFVDTYGERALMAPKREGFNWAAYLLPFVAIGVGAIALVAVLRRMQRRIPAAVSPGSAAPVVVANDDELARLDAAIRRDA